MTLAIKPQVGDYVRHKKKGGIYQVAVTNVIMKMAESPWTTGVAYVPANEPGKLCVRDIFWFCQNFEPAMQEDFVKSIINREAKV